MLMPNQGNLEDKKSHQFFWALTYFLPLDVLIYAWSATSKACWLMVAHCSLFSIETWLLYFALCIEVTGNRNVKVRNSIAIGFESDSGRSSKENEKSLRGIQEKSMCQSGDLQQSD
ncbi:hypothetical protein HDV64DRAFT_250873 [Trichoderma sp. TUCIM 5745]